MKINGITLGELPDTYDVDLQATRLVATNPTANKPHEPYCGVAALFNADLHVTEPAWAPREHWITRSAFKIEHRPVEEIIAELSETALAD